MWVGVLWAGLRVAMWIAHVGGKYRHGLLEKSLTKVAIALTPLLTSAEGRPSSTWCRTLPIVELAAGGSPGAR